MISEASPMHMARDLIAQGHSDIGFIIAHVKRDFGRAPTREAIEKLRAEYVAHREATQSRVVQSEEKRAARERIRQANAHRRLRARRAAA